MPIKNNASLLTEDKDFGELVYRLRYPAHAILLLRFDPTQKSLKYTRLLKFLNDRPSQIIGAFVVLEADKVRIRPLTPP